MIRVALTLLITAVLSVNLSSAQPAFHTLAGYSVTKTMESELGLNPWLTTPFTGILSHVIADSYIGEGGLSYQVDLGLVRYFIMWMETKESEKNLFLWATFWSILPDLLYKPDGTKYFHDYNVTPAVQFGETTNIAEELSVLIYMINF